MKEEDLLMQLMKEDDELNKVLEDVIVKDPIIFSPNIGGFMPFFKGLYF